jgi:hypothetical protein
MTALRMILYDPAVRGWNPYESSFWADNLVELHELYTESFLLSTDARLYVLARHVFESEWSPIPDVSVASIMLCGGEVEAFLDFVDTIQGQANFIFVMGEQVGGPISTRIAAFLAAPRGSLSTFPQNCPALRLVRGGRDEYGPN